ncbi:MAG: hypothetical protein AAGF98_13975 [Cyanobacteria bacterium P01_H01_bin.153]
MADSNAVARHVMEKDDVQSNECIASIQNLMMRARLTQEGAAKFESEIQFYTSRQTLNRMISDSGDENLIRMNAVNIVLRILFTTDIPLENKSDGMKTYRGIVEEYGQYLKVLGADFCLSDF